MSSERYPGMDAFAAALTAYLGVRAARTRPQRARRAPVLDEGGGAARAVCLTAKRSGSRSSATASRRRPAGRRPDRLYLDVGNDRRAGVIDHHQVESAYDG